MSSYYREHVSFPNVAPSDDVPHVPVNVSAPVDNAQHDDQPAVRHCSVRGCSAALPPDYGPKMCETCRGRHRIYASTKRAKRKMEKAALGSQLGQPVVWMPPDDTADEGENHSEDNVHAPIPRLIARAPSQPLASASDPAISSQSQSQGQSQGQSQYPYSQSLPAWDQNAIDPRLFTNSSSELAGALTLPSSSHQSPSFLNRRDVRQPDGLVPPSLSPTAYASSPASQERQYNSQTALSPPVHTGNNIPRTSVTSEEPPSLDESMLPPRYCSIKGCKTIISGASFYKMCQPCRDRYRNYGTTKRAKWKREKDYAVAQLQRMREEEDKRRADAGLPPLASNTAEWHAWHGENGLDPSDPLTPEAAGPSNIVLPPRMCTVSHCREILPGTYQYLRCERHRIQNRHHSKLKRVRDKESKAIAYDEWSAAVNAGRASEDRDATEEPSDREHSRDAEERDILMMQLAGPGALEETLQEPSTGVPPAARGSRRTNYVCSIKACNNLLSPNNPWKMCDSCRARDRTVRRVKALRDSGAIVDLPDQLKPSDDDGEKKAPKKKKKKKSEKQAGKEKQKQKEKETEKEPATEASVSASTSAAGPFSQIPGTMMAIVSPFTTAPLQFIQHGIPVSEGNTPSHISQDPPTKDPTRLVFMHPLLPESVDETPASTIPASSTGVFSASTMDPVVRASPIARPAQTQSDEPFPQSLSSSNARPITPRVVRRTPSSSKRVPKRRKQYKSAATVDSDDDSPAASVAEPATSTELETTSDETTATLATTPAPTTTTHETTPAVTVAAPAVISTPTTAPAVTSTLAPVHDVSSTLNTAPAIASSSTTPNVPVDAGNTMLGSSASQPIVVDASQPPADIHMQPQYFSYYMPPPYSMASYPPSTYAQQYPYGSYAFASPYAAYPHSYAYPPLQHYPPGYSSSAYAPPPPPPVYSVSSAFVSRAEYASAVHDSSSSTTTFPAAPAAPEPASYSSYSTFSARTGEPYHRAPHAPSLLRRKRALDQKSQEAETSASKRVAVGRGDGADTSVVAVVEQHPPAVQPVQPDPQAPAVASAAVEPPAEVQNEDGHGAVASVSVRAAEGVQPLCSVKGCHRALPAAGTGTGTICERCKGRLKKRQSKAKKMYRLEPRKSLALPRSGDASDQTSLAGEVQVGS